MPTKRAILETIHRDTLIFLVEEFDLDVADKRRRDLLVEALATSRRATLPKILGSLKRDDLKACCRQLDLDDGGRKKAKIIDRLIGKPSVRQNSTLSAPPAAPRPAPAHKKKTTMKQKQPGSNQALSRPSGNCNVRASRRPF